MIGNGIFWIRIMSYVLNNVENCVASNCSHNTILRIENDVRTVSRAIF